MPSSEEKPRSDDERLSEFVSRIPLTWTCVKCGFEGRNAPDAEYPVAVQIGVRPDGCGGMERYEVGPICSRCMS
jgi:hypothetical protein